MASLLFLPDVVILNSAKFCKIVFHISIENNTSEIASIFLIFLSPKITTNFVTKTFINTASSIFKRGERVD